MTSPGGEATILHYLRHRLPGYPYNDLIDPDFVDELLDDFPNSNVLEEIKAFRWYHENDPAARVRNLRIAIRRWVANGAKNRY
jgi:hypothetical protein